MTGAEWIYKYVFQSKYFNVAKIKSEFKYQVIGAKYKCPYVLIEYKFKKEWRQIGLL